MEQVGPEARGAAKDARVKGSRQPGGTMAERGLDVKLAYVAATMELPRSTPCWQGRG
jgi:hypothetical protein